MKYRKNRRLNLEKFEYRRLLAYDLSFEDVGTALGSESFWNGPDPNGQPTTGTFGDAQIDGSFTSGGLRFNNRHSVDFQSWSGWAYSNTTDTTTGDFTNQHSAFTGGGIGGTDTYAVAYQGEVQPSVERLGSTSREPFDTLVVTNTTYTARSILEGDGFARRFGWYDANGDGDFDDSGDAAGTHPDWLLLTVEGVGSGGQSIGAVEFYLADYRFADSALDYIIGDWTPIDVSSLADAERLEFSLTSSDVGPFGMNTPSYFALDLADSGFEDVGATLDPESAFAGPDPNGTPSTGPFGDSIVVGKFSSGGLEFNNTYSLDFGSWSGWSYTNQTDTTTPGFTNQHSAFAGEGAIGSASYATAFSPAGAPATIQLTDQIPAQRFESLKVTNATYSALSMLQGDAFARRFGWFDSNNDGDFDDPGDAAGTHPDWFLLTITGRDDTGESVGTVDFFLADYRFPNSQDDYIVDDWVEVDVSSLDKAHSLEFSLSSSDVGGFGMNTPAYFSVDNVHVVPADLEVSAVTLNQAESDPADLLKGPQPANASWANQRSRWNSIDVAFNQATHIAAITRDQLTLENLGIDSQQQPVTIDLTEAMLEVVDAITLRISFPESLPGEELLTDGVYRLTVDESASTPDGRVMQEDFVQAGNSDNEFYRLTSDWNGDGFVTIRDFLVFAYWYTQPVGVAPAYVDLNGDQSITIRDFLIFAAHYETSIDYPDAILLREPATKKNRAVQSVDEVETSQVNDVAIDLVLREWTT